MPKTAPSKQLAVIEKKVPQIVEEAEKLEIENPAMMEVGVELLSRLNQMLDSVETEEDKVLKPLKEAVKAEQSRWKPFKDVLKPAIESLRKRISKYQTEAQAKADEDAAKLMARQGEGKGKLKTETVIKKMGEITTPEAKVSTSVGSVQFRATEKFEVEDVSKLPLEYLLPNEVLIRKAMLAGTKLPGVRYYTEQVPINRR